MAIDPRTFHSAAARQRNLVLSMTSEQFGLDANAICVDRRSIRAREARKTAIAVLLALKTPRDVILAALDCSARELLEATQSAPSLVVLAITNAAKAHIYTEPKMGHIKSVARTRRGSDAVYRGLSSNFRAIADTVCRLFRVEFYDLTGTVIGDRQSAARLLFLGLLRYGQNVSPRGIAEILDMRQGSVNGSLATARRRMRTETDLLQRRAHEVCEELRLDWKELKRELEKETK